jgi:hypothetical protein
MSEDLGQDAPAGARCAFCSFGLVVTGEGEELFLPRLFRSLMERSGSSFRVLSRIGQRDPVVSEFRRIKMIGSGKEIPTEDEEQIGFPARRFLRNQPCRFLVLIDDLEHDRRDNLEPVFQRYRRALDTLLKPEERRRASVHFFVPMLEAYYFAHSAAVNTALGTTVIESDSVEDVETLHHPKNDLKNLHHGFNEKEDGAEIVPLLDLDHILRNPQSCAFLRSLVEWCVRHLVDNCPVHDQQLGTRYELAQGAKAALTSAQSANHA